MENKNNDFVDGLFIDRKETAPDFVICKASFKVGPFCEWLKANANEKGYVNIDVLKAQSGKLYAKKNEFKPTPQVEKNDDLPF
jgi:hypothetical protein